MVFGLNQVAVDKEMVMLLPGSVKVFESSGHEEEADKGEMGTDLFRR